MQPSSEDVVGKLPMHNLKELAEILVRHNGLHEGLYNLSIEFRIAVASVGPVQQEALPSGVVSVAKIGLEKTDVMQANTVDAAVANPPKKTKPRKVRPSEE